MLTAISSFVNDWIEQHTEHHELGEIEYGGSKIIIESCGFSYIAVMVDGAVYNDSYEQIRTTLADIVLTHGDDIRAFNGDLSRLPNQSIQQKIYALMEKNNKKIASLLRHK